MKHRNGLRMRGDASISIKSCFILFSILCANKRRLTVSQMFPLQVTYIVHGNWEAERHSKVSLAKEEFCNHKCFRLQIFSHTRVLCSLECFSQFLQNFWSSMDFSFLLCVYKGSCGWASDFLRELPVDSVQMKFHRVGRQLNSYMNV